MPSQDPIQESYPLFYADASFSGQHMPHHPIYSKFKLFYLLQLLLLLPLLHLLYFFLECLLNLHEDELQTKCLDLQYTI